MYDKYAVSVDKNTQALGIYTVKCGYVITQTTN